MAGEYLADGASRDFIAAHGTTARRSRMAAPNQQAGNVEAVYPKASDQGTNPRGGSCKSAKPRAGAAKNFRRQLSATDRPVFVAAISRVFWSADGGVYFFIHRVHVFRTIGRHCAE